MQKETKNNRTGLFTGILVLVILSIIILSLPGSVSGQTVENDTDADGMADEWEIFVGLNSSDPEDAELDPDNDGFSNLEEFEAKTNPFDQKEAPEFTDEKRDELKSMIAIGAALAIGIAGIGSATGIGIAGAAGVGATGEKPEVFSRSLVYQVLPMTQVVYAFIFAVLLFVGAGIFIGDGSAEVFTHPYIGYAAIAIGLTIGLTGLSAIGQGITASASIGSYARNKEVFARGMMFTVMSETIAVFGFVIALFILLGFGFL
ncbi:MAG: hypothetical protein JSV49_10550 [Thermoplasmata archaeon]|nr:MAG: hypothetical protein JSV49_10550 [Thermoplasmata archaeon]